MRRAESVYKEFNEGEGKCRAVSEMKERPRGRFQNLFFTPHEVINGRFCGSEGSVSGNLPGKRSTRIIIRPNSTMRT